MTHSLLGAAQGRCGRCRPASAPRRRLSFQSLDEKLYFKFQFEKRRKTLLWFPFLSFSFCLSFNSFIHSFIPSFIHLLSFTLFLPLSFFFLFFSLRTSLGTGHQVALAVDDGNGILLHGRRLVVAAQVKIGLDDFACVENEIRIT